MPENQSRDKSLFFILAIAFLVRIVFEFEMASSPYFGALFLDELYNHNLATRIANGDLIGNAAFFKAPLYTYLLGVFAFILRDDFFLIKLLQHLIGLSSIVIIYALARRLFDKRVAIISAAIFAIYPIAIFFEGEYLDIFLQLAFYPAILLTTIVLIERRRIRFAVILGVLLGLSALARPTVILFIPVALVYIAAMLRGAIGSRSIAKYVVVVVACFLITISPATIHNFAIGRTFVPISYYGGINFYVGNGDYADGLTPGVPRKYLNIGTYKEYIQIYSEKESEDLTGKKLSPAEQSSFWVRKTLSYMAEDPVRSAKLFVKKAILFWNGREIRNNKDIYFASQFSRTLRVLLILLGFGILAPFGLCGIALAVKRKTKHVWLPILFVATYMIGTILFFVCGRFRLPIVPIISIFAGYTVWVIVENIRNDRWGYLFSRGIVFLAVALFVNANWYDVHNSGNRARDLWNIGNCYKQKGKYKEALASYDKVVNLNPNYIDAYNNMGEVYYLGGEYDKAVECFKKTLEVNESYFKAYNNLGVCYEAKGKFEIAQTYYLKVLERHRDHFIAQTNLGDVYFKQKHYDRARMEYEKALEINPEHTPAQQGVKASRKALSGGE